MNFDGEPVSRELLRGMTDAVRHRGPEDYLIRVNRQPAARDEPLKDGDRVSVTPLKIEGAT